MSFILSVYLTFLLDNLLYLVPYITPKCFQFFNRGGGPLDLLSLFLLLDIILGVRLEIWCAKRNLFVFHILGYAEHFAGIFASILLFYRKLIN